MDIVARAYSPTRLGRADPAARHDVGEAHQHMHSNLSHCASGWNRQRRGDLPVLCEAAISVARQKSLLRVPLRRHAHWLALSVAVRMRMR